MPDEERYDIPIYSRPARSFHWWIAFFILLQVPIGVYMKYRGYEMETVNDKGEVVKGVWDGVTDTLYSCLLYTSDAADDLLCVDLGGRRIIKKTL